MVSALNRVKDRIKTGPWKSHSIRWGCITRQSRLIPQAANLNVRGIVLRLRKTLDHVGTLIHEWQSQVPDNYSRAPHALLRYVRMPALTHLFIHRCSVSPLLLKMFLFRHTKTLQCLELCHTSLFALFLDEEAYRSSNLD
jgi:hypothetical protein